RRKKKHSAQQLYARNLSGHKYSFVTDLKCARRKRHGNDPVPEAARDHVLYCKMTWSPSFRPFNTSVFAPLEIPMLIAVLRFPSLPLGSGISTEALRSLSYRI